MRKRIQRYLGIEELIEGLDVLSVQFRQLSSKLAAIHDRLSVTDRALGRIIAKLDPTFADSEFDPARKAESDRIGAEVMRKLIGEHLASKAPQD
jgi:hypothetical protein